MLRVYAVCFQRVGRGFQMEPRIVAFKTDLPFILFQVPAPDNTVFTDHFPPFTVDFKPVGSRQISCGSYKGSGRAVFKLQIGCNIIFHFNMMPFSFMAYGPDLYRHPAHPDQQIQLMGALVQQHTAAFTGPGRPPCSGVVIPLRPVPVGNQPGDSLNPAKVSGIQSIPNRPVSTVCPLVKHIGKAHSCFPCCFCHVPGCVHRNRCRFFAQYVEAVLHCFHRQRLMAVMRCSDQYSVTFTLQN